MAATGECLCEQSAAIVRTLPTPPGVRIAAQALAGGFMEGLVMEQGAEQVRLVITVFDAVEDLEGPLAALISRGFLREQLCLAASEPVMARAATKLSTDGIGSEEFRALSEHVEIWPKLADGYRVVASSGSILNMLARASLQGSPGASAETIAGEQGSELVAELLRGAIALIVRSASAQQHVNATRLLLRASSHRVRTYHYTIPASSA